MENVKTMFYFLDNKTLEEQVIILKGMLNSIDDPKIIYIVESLIDSVENEIVYKRENIERIVETMKELKSKMNEKDYGFGDLREKIGKIIDDVSDTNNNIIPELLREPLDEINDLLVDVEEYFDLCDLAEDIREIIGELNDEIDV